MAEVNRPIGALIYKDDNRSRLRRLVDRLLRRPGPRVGHVSYVSFSDGSSNPMAVTWLADGTFTVDTEGT